MKTEIRYIKNKITIKLIRNFILDFKLTENDTILLNQFDWDSILIEHRETYKESLTVPYILLGVLIKENIQQEIGRNQVIVLKNDFASVRKIAKNKNEFYAGEIAYRCGWCGNIVDDNGTVLHGEERNRKIRYIEEFSDPIVYKRNGKCCPNGDN